MKTLRSMLQSERGSAMTEFVIGLPVFILIFAGMGSIYNLHHEGIGAKMEVNQALWASANPGAPASGMVPLGTFAGMSDWGDLAVDGAGALGMYADSYAKTVVPLTALGAIGSTRPSEGCMTLGCDQINMPNNYFARPLLDDNIITAATGGGLDFSGWASAITSVLDIVGARPAVAAGVRYGSLVSPSVTRDVSIPAGSYSMSTGDLRLPGITDPTHRIFAVALTRLEFGTKELWHEQIPEFNDEFQLGSGEAPDQNACNEAAGGAEDCADNPPTNPDTGEPDASLCEEQSSDACGGGSVPQIVDLGATWCSDGVPGC